MQTMTVAEFQEALKAQGVSAHEHFAFVCPICATVQSGADIMRALDKTFDEIEKYVAFSCIGRFTNAGPHKNGAPAGNGCDWTLGGLFSLHKLSVVTPDGKSHARFELATPEQAQAHEAASVSLQAA